MTNEERDIINRFIQRVAGAAPAASDGSVPASTPATPLPPVDKDADALIGQLFAQYPEARYRITQLAFVQEHALAEAANRISQLQYQLDQARQSAGPAPAASPWGAGSSQSQPQPSRGLFGGLFGGGSRAPEPPQYAPSPQYAPPPPQYAPGYQPGMFQRGGSGFLGSALTTAAGVAGGLVVGNALMNLFEPRGGGFASGPELGGGFAGAQPLPEPPAVPLSGADQASAPAADPWGAGGAMKDEPAADDKFANAPPPDTGGWGGG